MVTRALAFALTVALVIPRAAHAENAKLVEARAAIAAVQYDRARPLLLQALQAGEASPEEVAELYRLSASTATVLGDRELAEQYYRRWLAMDPSASLPSSIAPKLREPFIAAQAHMAAHGRLTVQARRDATAVTIRVTSDPLSMIANVAVDTGDALAPSAIDATGKAVVAMAPDAELRRVLALDEFGNTLVEIAPENVAVAEAPRVEAVSTTPSTSLVRRPITWAIPTVALAGVAIGFGFAARSANADLEDIVARSNEHFLAQAEDARARRDRNALLANVGFVAAGAFAIATAVVVITAPRSRAAVVPVASSQTVGLGAILRW